MKYKYLFLIPIVFISCMLYSYGQTKIKMIPDTIYASKEKLYFWRDSAIVKKDSTHYWFQNYIKLKNEHVPDSLNRFYKKLMNKK